MSESRREFLKKTALAAAGVAIGVNAKSYARIIGANDRLNFGIIGLHGRAYAHLEGAKMTPNSAVTHICDVDKRELEKFSKAVKDSFGTETKTITDFRRMLESKDVDVITIATPEHWHAPMAIMGLQAGKHVYVEKPCSHNPHEGELLVAAQMKYKKLVQMGNQQRSSEHTIEVMKKIHDGVIGNPYLGKSWYVNVRKPIGIGKVVPVPEYLDWELWQGPAPRKEYKDNIHPYNWHWFWHWGTGETLNNGTHEVDLCRWALQVNIPNKISAAGGRYHAKDDWEFYDSLVTNFEFGDKTIVWEGRSCNGKKYFDRDRGCAIYGTTGTVVLDRGGYEIYNLEDKKVDEFKARSEASTQDFRSIDSMTCNHFKNLADAIRTQGTLRSPIEEGNKSVTILQISNIAWKVGRDLHLDTKTAHILNDEKAMKMWKREYEKGWEPKV